MNTGDLSGNESSLLLQLTHQRQELTVLRERLALMLQALHCMGTHFLIARHVRGDALVHFCNRVVAEQHGFKPEELKGMSIRALFGSHWDLNEMRARHAALSRGESVEVEQEVRRKDGSTVWLGLTLIPMRWDTEGKLQFSMSVGMDITVQREAQRREKELQEQLVLEMKKRERVLLELRVAQKLEAVGSLAAGIAHEINTPIQYVADSMQFLRNSFDDMQQLVNRYRQVVTRTTSMVPADELAMLQHEEERVDLSFLEVEIPKAFTRTLDGTARVANIVSAMKEFSHPDAGEFSSADLNHALANTLVVATNEYKYNAQVHTEFAADLPLVICNIGELNQVFLNLIVNAAHAIQDSGKSVDQGVITIATARAGDFVEITIGDNGCGIPRQNLDKIYDPFFTTKAVGRGTGQGLAITHSIVVDKHGGTVQVYSEQGEGTQFIVSLPIAGKPRAAAS